MKKLIIALSVLVMSGAAMAQTKTTFYPNGQKQAEGTLLNADATVLSKDFESLPKETQMQKMQNCVKDGKWTMWYENGATYSEQFYKNGLMTGVWKNYQPDGSVADIIDFENGKASYFHKNGKVQSEGKISGQMGQEGKWIFKVRKNVIYFDYCRTQALLKKINLIKISLPINCAGIFFA